MTKKDYVRLTAVINYCIRNPISPTVIEQTGELNGYNRIAQCIGKMLAADNAKFDLTKFLSACENIKQYSRKGL